MATSKTRNNGKQQAARHCYHHHCRGCTSKLQTLQRPASALNTSYLEEQAGLGTLVLSLQVKPDALICKPCKDDATRVLANPTHIPRWEKAREVQKEKYYILLCTDVFVRG